MKDFESVENANIEHIRSHFKRLSTLYGFSFMDPSPIELLSTLETKSGPSIRD
jgi:histidyl-tRNA synthetase